SRTVTVIVCGPLAKPAVSHGIETLAPPVVCVLISVPPTETVNGLDDPLAPLTRMTTQPAPPTVDPAPGAVTAIDRVPPAGGGGRDGRRSAGAVDPDRAPHHAADRRPRARACHGHVQRAASRRRRRRWRR